MTLYRLFHLRPTGDLSETAPEFDIILDAGFRGKASGAIRAGLYREVARVETDEIASVFPLTNHIDHDWTQNEAVHMHAPGSRSTSVGDLVLDERDGSLHACMPAGWAEVDPADRDAFLQHLGRAIPVLDHPDLTVEDRPTPG